MLTLNICTKLKISVISSSQWNTSLVTIFWVIWRKVMHTCEAPDFWKLDKTMNSTFPLIKLFWYMSKKSRQKLKYLENKKNFWGEMKSIFHNFKRVVSCQKLFHNWECVFKTNRMMSTKWSYRKEWSFASNDVIFFENFVSVSEPPKKSWFDVPITQMSIFIFFVSAGVLFNCVFSLKVLKDFQDSCAGFSFW